MREGWHCAGCALSEAGLTQEYGRVVTRHEGVERFLCCVLLGWTDIRIVRLRTVTKRPYAFPSPTRSEGRICRPQGWRGHWPERPRLYFGLHGMGVAPAGVERPNSGHHHLLVDTDLPPLDQPIPNDENHLHCRRQTKQTSL